MDNQPSFDRGFIPPIAIGIFSLFGICLVLLLGRLSAARGGAPIEETSTPFQYIFLGTEPGISTTTTPASTAEEESNGEGFDTPTAVVLFSPAPDIDETATGTALTESPATPPTFTPTSASTPPLNPGIYDEVDTRIIYAGDWTVQSGVAGAYQNSLHVSSVLGNTVTLRFIGQQIRIFYQSGTSLGTIRIVVDGLQFELDQSGTEAITAEWASSLLVNGTHTVVITHISGGSINLDYVVVPDIINTATPAP